MLVIPLKLKALGVEWGIYCRCWIVTIGRLWIKGSDMLDYGADG